MGGLLIGWSDFFLVEYAGADLGREGFGGGFFKLEHVIIKFWSPLNPPLLSLAPGQKALPMLFLDITNLMFY